MPAARLPLLFAAGALILACAAAQANNIAVENVSLVKQNPEAKTVLVSFDLAWDNSWRNGANHDAAWVFVKFRPQGSNEWEHAILSSNSGSHFPGGKSVIKAVPGGGGVFVHTSVNHTGSEIEQAYIEALYSAFSEDKEPTDLTVSLVLNDQVPLSKPMAEQIEGLRKWAKARARMATSRQDERKSRRIAA